MQATKKLNYTKTGHLTNLHRLYLQLDKGGMCIRWAFRHNNSRHTSMKSDKVYFHLIQFLRFSLLLRVNFKLKL